MDSEDVDRSIRLEAFSFLVKLTQIYGDLLPRQVLATGFTHGGVRVPLVGPQGIFKPAAIPTGMPLSVTTVPPVEGKTAPYEDVFGPDNLLRYRYRGQDAQHHENVGLRQAMAQQAPLIYFWGVTPGWYLPQWPVFIVGDDPSTLTFTVAVDDAAAISQDLVTDTGNDARRAYVTRLARQRLHQVAFRQRVLRAYRETCAVCRLHHQELLDAAHILPDGHPHGAPVVPNGLALCKLHHAAFDRNILGVRPDLVVEIRSDILEEIDGPMLRHGLQELDGSRLVVPRSRLLTPKVAFLAERYEAFKKAG